MRSNPFIGLNKLIGTMQLYSEFVSVNEETRFRFKETVNVLQGPIGRLRVEEVCGWNEREANDRPYNPELISEILNAWKCGLHNAIVAYPVRRFHSSVTEYRESERLDLPMASDAPLVRISSALILHGTSAQIFCNTRRNLLRRI